MSLFICQNCGCIENTACGHWWARETCIFGGGLERMALCSACMPDHYASGESCFKGGKGWHGHFPRVQATPEEIERHGRGNFVGPLPDPPAGAERRKPPKGPKRSPHRRERRRR